MSTIKIDVSKEGTLSISAKGDAAVILTVIVGAYLIYHVVNSSDGKSLSANFPLRLQAA